MADISKEYEIKRRREYHRKWRAEHPDKVRAAQMRYWVKKAEQAQRQAQTSAADTGSAGQEEGWWLPDGQDHV